MSEATSIMSECKPRPLKDLRLLIVEDEADTRSFLALLLKQQGAVVRAVGSAEEAMASLESHGTDILISDIGMPGEDGFALIRRVRARENERSLTPVAAIALTAYADEPHRRRALEDGYQTHVAKPVDPVQFIALLASLAPSGG